MNKKYTLKIKFLIFCFVLVNNLVFAQDPGAGNSNDTENVETPQPPTTAAIMKFVESPVDLNTGIANVSVPLYQFNSRVMSIPINLNYHAGGHKVNDIAGWTGLGWSLSCNFAITRTVMGKPDGVGLDYSSNPIIGAIQNGDITNLENYGLDLLNMANGDLDGQPDLYSFSFPGGSGSFVFDQNGIPHIKPYQDTKIEYNNDQNFIITDNKGNKFYFEEKERSTTWNSCASGGAPTDGFYINSWHLTRIVSANNLDIIYFTYEKSDLVQHASVSHRRLLTETANPYTELGYCSGYGMEPFSECINTVSSEGVHLKSISSSYGGSIEFDFKFDRLDHIYGARLENINVIKNGSTLRSFDLEYYYSQSYAATGPNMAGLNDGDLSKRLKLKSVTEKSSEGNAKPPFIFEYMDEKGVKLPPRLSFDQDHWGYSNGAGNSNLVPEGYLPPLFNDEYNLADRNANENFANGDMLYQINFPTGGFRNFEYESNGWQVSNVDQYYQYLSNSEYESTSLHLEANFTDPFSPNFDEDIIILSVGTLITYEMISTNNSPEPQQGYIEVIDSNGNNLCNNLNYSLSCGPHENGQWYNGAVFLEPGEYTVRAVADVPGDFVEVYFYWEIPPTVNPNFIPEVKGGGVRVLSQNLYESANSSNNQKLRYSYSKHTNAKQSSGKLLNQLGYVYNHQYRFDMNDVYDESNEDPITTCGPNICTILGIKSNNRIGVGTNFKRPIVYTNVTTYRGLDENNGKTEYIYTHYMDGGLGTDVSMPGTSMDWKRGLLLEQIDYKGSSQTGYEEVQRLINEYDFRDDSEVNVNRIPALVVEWNLLGDEYCISPPIDINEINTYFDYGVYEFISQWYVLRNTTVIKDGVDLTTNYVYDEVTGLHTNPIETSFINSDSKEHKTKYYYAHEVYGDGSLMVNRNMVSIPLRIKSLVNQNITDDLQISYNSFGSKWLPDVITRGNSSGQRVLADFDYLNGNPISKTSYTGITETFTWYNNRMTSHSIQEEWTKNYIWDSSIDRVTQIIEIDGHKTTYDYDDFQRLETTKHIGIGSPFTDYYQITENVYNIGAGNNSIETTVTYSDGTPSQVSLQRFDGIGRPFETSLNGVVKEQILYDNLGRLKAKTYLPGSLTIMDYENSPLSRVISEIYPDGSHSETEYGSAGNYFKVIVNDENGNPTSTLIDKLDRPYTITDALNNITTYLYDNNGNVERIIPPNSDEAGDYVFTYDGFNQLRTKQVPDGGLQEFIYNGKGLLVLEQNPVLQESNRWVVSEYDSFNRLERTGFFKGQNSTSVLALINDGVLSNIFYDDIGNLPFVADLPDGTCIPEASLGKEVGRSVNILNELDTSNDWLESYVCYDELGRATGSYSNNPYLGGNNISLTNYNDASLVTDFSTRHQSNSDYIGYSEFYTYDNFLRQESNNHLIEGPQEIERNINFSAYNNLDQLEEKFVGGSIVNPGYLQEINYDYNARGWLTHINDIDNSFEDEGTTFCDSVIDECPALCDYEVTVCDKGRLAVTDMQVNIYDPTSGEYINADVNLNFPYYIFQLGSFEIDLENWLNGQNIPFDDVIIDHYDGVDKDCLTLLVTQTSAEFWSISTEANYLFTKFNCTEGERRAVCEECDPDLKYIRPLSLSIKYDHELISNLDTKEGDLPLLRLDFKGQKMGLNNKVRAFESHKNVALNPESVIPSNTNTVMNIVFDNMWIDNSNKEQSLNEIKFEIIEELYIAGIDSKSIQEMFVGAVIGGLDDVIGNSFSENKGNPISNNPDLFSLRLAYDETLMGVNASEQRNGNIAGLVWKTIGRSANSYSFEYDAINRLLTAEHGEASGFGQFTQANLYDIAVSYDNVGNILSLDRNGVIEDCEIGYDFGLMDQLSYKYKGNLLEMVSESANTEFGFKGEGGTYQYDSNGNMTVDQNKGINIQYNHLNLPYLITKDNGETIKIFYTSDGQKIKQESISTLSAGDNKIKYYMHGIEYWDEGLSGATIHSINHQEGKVIKEKGETESTYLYEYYLKDHLGNSRVVFNDKDQDGLISLSEENTELVQESHYYPFGMMMNGDWEQHNVSENDYLYNGKELVEDIGLDWYDYGARWYDASIGRWNAVDPLAVDYPSISTYAYVANTPINAIDPDGRKILFINGHYQDNWVGRNIVGSDKGGRAYWGSGFASAAQNFFNDYASISDANYIDGSSRIGIDMSGQDRYDAGLEYAKANIDALTGDLSEGETFKLVTHSEGSAYGAGIAQYLIDQGFEVETVVHISSDEGNEFSTPTEPSTYQLSYDGDWVTGNHNIKGTDKSGLVNSGLGWKYVHGSTRNARVFKQIADLKTVRTQDNIGMVNGRAAAWKSQIPGTTANGTDFTRINGIGIMNQNGTPKTN